MDVVTYQDYFDIKQNFIKKHNYDFVLDTSPMNSSGGYHKVYMFRDGAAWYESMNPVFQDVEIEVKGVKLTVTVKLLETEFWTSEFGSKYYYEKF